jgi:hypothetical protein
MEDDFMNEIKVFFVAVVSALLSLLSPIKDYFHAMIIVFVINFLCGLIADYRSGGKWSMKKAMVFFYHILVFSLLASSIFVIGHFMHNREEALFCVKTLCFIALWFYSINILKNLRIMLIDKTPMWNLVNFLYFIVSLKMVNKIPFLNDYLITNKAFEEEITKPIFENNTGGRSNGN